MLKFCAIPNIFTVFIDPMICKTVRDLTDSTGAYLKTACTVNFPYTQYSARASCLTFGMQLFTFNTAEDEKSLLAYADSQWPHARLWVEGTNGTGCSAISNQNKTKFEKISDVCANDYSFYCEYKGR